jgi:hypothetical protein
MVALAFRRRRMRVKAEMRAFADGYRPPYREIYIPDEEAKDRTTKELLELAFKYGQLDFTPEDVEVAPGSYSLSVGDVVVLPGEGGRWRVMPIGWRKAGQMAYTTEVQANGLHAVVLVEEGHAGYRRGLSIDPFVDPAKAKDFADGLNKRFEIDVLVADEILKWKDKPASEEERAVNIGFA